MAVQGTYELGVSGTAFTGAANREDLLDVVTVISPVDTPLFTMFRKVKVSNVATEWLTDLLNRAGTNAVAEGSSAAFTNTLTARQRLLNYCQISREDYDISDTQRAVNPARTLALSLRKKRSSIRLYAGNPEHPEARLAA